MQAKAKGGANAMLICTLETCFSFYLIEKRGVQLNSYPDRLRLFLSDSEEGCITELISGQTVTVYTTTCTTKPLHGTTGIISVKVEPQFTRHNHREE